MIDNSTGKPSRSQDFPYCAWCCSPFGAALWGGFLFVVGASLLLQRLHLVPAPGLQFLWPLLLLGLGTACLIWAARSHRAN